MCSATFGELNKFWPVLDSVHFSFTILNTDCSRYYKKLSALYSTHQNAKIYSRHRMMSSANYARKLRVVKIGLK